jgi:membrane peptidoglycan carboxypeptidase
MGEHGAVEPLTWLRSLSWKKRIGVAAGTFLLLLVGFVGIGYALTDVPTPNKIATDQATRVLYADGTEMGRIGKNREIVALDKISKDAQHAILAAEDRGFYKEPGISPKGIARALFTNVKGGGGVQQGGSTITQQYAKNAFLTHERTYTRKVKEVFIALKMSQTVSKDKILEDYLNTIYFGRGAYGIQAAAKAYFNVDAAKLTPAQSAVLASSIRSPAGYDPARHPERAKERWAYVLDGMVKQKWLSPEYRQRAVYPAVRTAGTRTAFPGELDYVRTQVTDDLERHGFPEDRITAGGLEVRTTIVRAAQNAAREAVEGKIPSSKAANAPVGALVSVEPGTGKVVAYYGGRDAGGFDYASDGRGVQPGSSMKPYVLAAALEKGMSLDSRLDGSSPQRICGTRISNDEGDPPFGRIDLATGLQYSANTVYYRLACEIGAQRVADVAHAAGIPASQPLADDQSHKPTAQIALGSGGYEIHVIDQAAGYATFAARGQRATPYFVQLVKDNDGNELYKAKASTGKAFSEGIAADTTYAMQKVVQGGTGTRAQLDGRPTAGKTGTTGNNANAWFAGFTPQLSTAVWVGRKGGGPLTGVLGTSRGVYGGTVPAEIFKAYMDKALDGKPVEQFPPRANVGQAVNPQPPVTVTPSVSARPTATATPSAVPTVVVTTAPPVNPTTAPPVLPPPPTSASPSPSPAASQAASPAASP